LFGQYAVPVVLRKLLELLSVQNNGINFIVVDFLDGDAITIGNVVSSKVLTNYPDLLCDGLCNIGNTLASTTRSPKCK
jgi:hypothetical protein